MSVSSQIRMVSYCVVMVAGFAIVMGLLPGALSEFAYGQSEPRQGLKQDKVKPRAKQLVDVSALVKKGYRVAGPYYVNSVSANSLVLYTGIERRNIVMSMLGKRVSVRDTAGKTSALGQVQAKSRVIVAAKGAELVIYVLPAKEGTKNE